MAETIVNGNKIKELRLARRWTQGYLEIRSGVEQSLISRLEAGKRKNIELETLGKIADALGVMASELIVQPKGKERRPLEVRRIEQLESELEELRRHISHIGTLLRGPIPSEILVHGSVPAGEPETEEDIVDTLTFPTEYLAIRVSGDSLIDLDINPGDVVLIDTQSKEPKPGAIAVVRLLDTGEVTIKRFFRENDHVRLEPANHEYRTIEARNVEVIGVVVLSMRKR